MRGDGVFLHEKGRVASFGRYLTSHLGEPFPPVGQGKGNFFSAEAREAAFPEEKTAGFGGFLVVSPSLKP